ncbi:MAG: cytidine deaminase [Clostridia bacterium]|nr:cytidine deaminase [Clostridia bacterium]
MKLVDMAKDIANKNTCCGYSSFTVGAALLSKSGEVYTGFNVENHGIQSICAERTAFVKALSSGETKGNFVSITVVGKKLGQEKFIKTVPCGYCRQFMSEYAGPDFEINLIDEELGKTFSYKLKELLPESFEL